MYTIDSNPFADYGLYASNHHGQAYLLDPKSQFFTIYGKDGYQITKRKGNILILNGYIIADDLTDFQSKISSLQTVLKASGTRSVVLDQGAHVCFCSDGFNIDKVRITPGKAFGRIQIKLMII